MLHYTKSDVELSRKDQILDSASEIQDKPITSMLTGFALHVVQKVVLVGCDWWFLIHIFL